MRHNNVVSSHPKSTGIPLVDGLSMKLPDLGRHNNISHIYHILDICFNQLDAMKLQPILDNSRHLTNSSYHTQQFTPL